MKVIFLDVDGVLNAGRRVIEGTKGFELKDWVIPKAIDHLNRIVKETGAAVVVSSTWRIGKLLPELREMFEGVGFQGKIIGKTEKGPCSWHNDLGYPECSVGHRGAEIHDWLQNQVRVTTMYGMPILVEQFVILDDDSDLEPYREFHVHTDLYRGLTRRKAEAAMKILKRSKT